MPRLKRETVAAMREADPRQLLTARQLAKLLNVDRFTIYRLRDLPRYRIKRSLRFDEAEVRAYLAEKK